METKPCASFDDRRPMAAGLALLVAIFASNSQTLGQGMSARAFYTDFNSGVPPEFSASAPGAREIAGVGQYANYGFSGSFLWNQTGGPSNGTPGLASVLTLTDLPPHHSIDLNFLLAIIDTWD